MRLLPLLVALTLWLLAAPATRADWGPPIPLSSGDQQSFAYAVAVASGDRPAVLLDNRRARGAVLSVRRTDARGRPGRLVTVARSNNSIQGIGLFAGRGSDLVAGWLERINGSRRPVVAIGPALADRQVLAPGPRSTQFMDLAANRRGDAVVAFWRYAGTLQSSIFVAYRPAGGAFGTPQLLATGTVGTPAAAIDERGAAVVSWVDDAAVSVAERGAAAGAFTAPVRITAPTRPNGDIGVAIDNGRVVTSWVTSPRRGPNTVLVAERPSLGQPFAANAQVSVPAITAPRQTPEVALGGGRALVAWTQREDVIDRAALAIRPDGGGWQAPILRGAGVTVGAVDLLAATATRPPLLSLATDHRGVQTTTIRGDGTPAPARRIDIRPAGPFVSLAQGRTHTWLATTRNLGSSRKPRSQAVLIRSTP